MDECSVMFPFRFFQGKEVIEYYVNEILESGNSTFPRWSPPDGSDVITPSAACPVAPPVGDVLVAPPVADVDSQSELELGATAASLGTAAATAVPDDTVPIDGWYHADVPF